MPRSGRPRPDAAETRARLHEIVRQLAVEKGYSGTSIRDIAAAAKMSTASLYHYAASKDELFASAILEALVIYADRSSEIASSDLPAAIKLRMLVREQVAIHAMDRQNWGGSSDEWTSLPPRLRRPIVQLRRKHENNFKEVIRQGQADGAFAVEEVGVAVLAIFGMCAHVSIWYSPMGHMSSDDIADTFTGFILRFLSARPTMIRTALAVSLPPTPAQLRSP
jgi:AcrR family transcriptional regulator